MDLLRDRIDAGQQLATALRKYKNQNAVVLAIPRGGVPVGYIIAKELGLPLEVEMIKKIGHPYNPELAIGAVSLKGIEITEAAEDVQRAYIEEEVERIRDVLRKKYETYGKAPADVKGKIAILVDDGVATGSTLLAMIDLVRKNKPDKIVLAIPVGPARTIHKLKERVDEVICLQTPAPFYAIGQFYENFEQVSDKEVLKLLEDARSSITEKASKQTQ